MRKIMMYLNGVKSVCLMLLAYLTLSVAATSCNQDEFENYEPEKKREFTKAELIEQALSRMPQTRAENPNAVIIVTIRDTIHFQCTATETMTVYLDGEEYSSSITETNKEVNKIFTNGFPSHSITIVGSKEAIRSLNVDNCGLISLNVSGNTNLADLSCSNNNLDEIIWTDCSLEELYISNNEFSSIDVSVFSDLERFHADHNRLTNLDVSQNEVLDDLVVSYNQIRNISLPTNMSYFDISHNPITGIDLTENFYLIFVDVSYTQITDLDLSTNEELTFIFLEGIPIETFNQQSINSTSFAMYHTLGELNIAYTPFDSLDLSRNQHLYELNISGTNITQLDLANVSLGRFIATRSKLTNLKYKPVNFYYLHELRIERTPFEENQTNISNLSSMLPQRTENNPGHLYTYSSWVNIPGMLQNFTRINWVINR